MQTTPLWQVLPYRLQVYFLKLRESGSASAEDGVLLGHHLMDFVQVARRICAPAHAPRPTLKQTHMRAHTHNTRTRAR